MILDRFAEDYNLLTGWISTSNVAKMQSGVEEMKLGRETKFESPNQLQKYSQEIEKQ